MASPRVEINDTIPSVTKTITQEIINKFESCGILDRQNIHNNLELAQRRLGTTYALASGRMSITYAAESLRRYFGPEVFNHSGTVNLKFLRPVKDGDSVTVHGTVSHKDQTEGGTLVSVEIYCENQNGDKTAVGMGTALIP